MLLNEFMPSEIKILEEYKTENGWKMKVDVDGLDFEVTVEGDYWQKLTGGNTEPADLVRRSFEFLLDREPKESILRKFNLLDIERYFPEYSKTIQL